MKLPARLLFLLFTFVFSLFLFFVFSSTTFAQVKTAPSTNYPTTNTNPNVPNTLHNWTQNVMIEVMSAMTCQLTGIDPTNTKQQCLGVDTKTGKIGFVQSGGLPTEASAKAGGAVGVMGNMITMLYTPPLHTKDYFQNLAANFGIAKKTYAQQTGTGFNSLSPLMPLWSAFRDITYLVFVIIFVVIGLAIMLRVKIDPRTVMTLQNQIPKIIIGILLVTFSFAIAGFLIDLMWVFIYLGYGIIAGIPNVNVNSLSPTLIQGKTAMAAAGGVWAISGISSNIAFRLGDVLKNLIGVQGCENIITCFNSSFNPLNFVMSGYINAFDLIYNLLSFMAGGAMFWNVQHSTLSSTPVLSEIQALFKDTGAFPVGVAAYGTAEFLLREGLPWIITYLIVFFAILIALFRLWFTLLMAYIYILLDVVIAPFWILGGLLPGSKFSFSGWLRDIGSNLLAFPATFLMFLLGKTLTDAFSSGSENHFIPPLIGSPGNTSAIGAFIGLGFILITPNIVKMLKEALKAPKFDTAGAMQALGAGAGVPISTGKGIVNTLMGRGEWIPNPNAPGGWEQRGLGRSFLGRIFGGR